ncbi:SSSF family transport protein [Natrialba magadii ATCC 43099]|uniref:Na+/solute symporter n=1 Tax=Natrialba magadii (strain ATCC 43099 / DSM 3394 / CCM 3739 / CIP 104546 / IAM 13178 / JCM 8861 / NBRC 102185 / NCIMB 2190 / MS3) TaxID=547559 RepID=D3SS88_NATMM|nr:sodium:solute symporter family protein [Natrialba magadii]ADD04814.1 SSSF family transport protein [Natrialba magadii ATCC 43099]ELY24481.1 Na+/solute symporter [Natrialba magadii ATCC 43099]
MTLTLQLGIIVGYLILALAIGLVAYRLADRTAEDFYLASRTFGTIVLLFTTFATLLSAFTFFAGPNVAYQQGPEWVLVMGLMDGIIFAILWYVIGYKQWLLGQNHGYVTLGEMLGDRFGSTWFRGLVAGISLVWLFPYVMLQQVGAGTALTALTEGAIPYWAGAGLITAFMILYVVLAGMRGIAWTDTLQGAFMLVVTWVAMLWLLAVVGGPTSATAALEAEAAQHLALGSDHYTPQWMLSTAITIGFGVAMFPQVNQRFFAAGSRTVLKRSFALWPILCVLLFVPSFLIGAWARGLDVTIPEGGNVLPIVLAEYTPVWFAALVIAGAMAAMMSSSDSMLLSGSSYFTRDLYRPVLESRSDIQSISSRREDLVARVGVVVFATASFLVSLVNPATLFELGDAAFSGFAQLALPVLVALYWRGTTRAGMTAGILASQAFYLASLFTAVVPSTYAGWTAGLVGMGLGLVVTVVVSLVTMPAADEQRALYFDGLRSD